MPEPASETQNVHAEPMVTYTFRHYRTRRAMLEVIAAEQELDLSGVLRAAVDSYIERYLRLTNSRGE